jgi:Zn-dependent oligopeptidase
MNPRPSAPRSTARRKHICFIGRDFGSELKDGIRAEKRDIDSIKTDSSTPTFSNVFEALENSGQKRKQVCKIFNELLLLHRTPTIEKIASQFQKTATRMATELLLDVKLFKRVKSAYDLSHQWSLSSEERRLVNFWFRKFKDNGSDLPAPKKTLLKEYNSMLSARELKFSSNLIKETAANFIHVNSLAQLSGLPDDTIRAAKLLAKEKGQSGWILALDDSTIDSILMFANDRNLRKQAYVLDRTRCYKRNRYNNEKVATDIITLTQKKARLLGFKSANDMLQAQQMVKTKDRVDHFLARQYKANIKQSNKQLKELKILALRDGITDFNRWDDEYYSNIILKDRFNVDEELIRQHLPLDRVRASLFALINRLYGVSLNKTVAPVYHKSVECYRLTDNNGDDLGLIYFDLFPRKEKSSGAWASTFKERTSAGAGAAIVACNFAKDSKSTTTLLSMEDVKTLFHEVGHALHFLFCKSRFASLSSENVTWDFVELPSQLMENWATAPSCLNTFAFHHKTGKPLDKKIIASMKKSDQYFRAFSTILQINLTRLDMECFAADSRGIRKFEDFEKAATARYGAMHYVKGTSRCAQFDHIFGGGYSSKYYSYLWSEIMSTTAFKKWESVGILDRDISIHFRKQILEQGSSRDEMVSFGRFMAKTKTTS